MEKYDDRSDDDQKKEDEMDTSGIDNAKHLPAVQTEEEADKNDGELRAEHDPMIVRVASTSTTASKSNKSKKSADKSKKTTAIAQ